MVRQISVSELADRLAADDARGDVQFIDVRTPEEWQMARIAGFRLLDAGLAESLQGLAPETEFVFLCHHGMRSQAAAEHFAARGFSNVWNVTGGIDAWSSQIDPDVPRY